MMRVKKLTVADQLFNRKVCDLKDVKKDCVLKHQTKGEKDHWL